jgi:hypothetical protein
MMLKARDVKRGDWVRPTWVVGDVGRGWKVVDVKVRGEDVLIDVENTDGGGVHSLPVMGEDDAVRVQR